MFAVTPSPAPGPDAPSDRASSRASHRRMPTVGTATHSADIGSERGSNSTSARTAARGPARLALERWSTTEHYREGVTCGRGRNARLAHLARVRSKTCRSCSRWTSPEQSSRT